MRLKKISYIIFIMLFLVSILTSCTPKSKNDLRKGTSLQKINQDVTNYPLKITDSYNREITIEKEPLKIISAAPNITEIVFSLEKQDKLIGRTSYCDYPKEVSKITSIGDIFNPNIEKIVDMKPDLIIASSIFKKEISDKLEELGIKIVFVKDENNFDGVYNSILKTGLILNANVKAKNLVFDMKARIAEIKKKLENAEKKSVYYVVGYGQYGDFTAGKDTFISDMIENAGGKNVADDVTGWQYSLERLIEKNPEIIICSKYGNAKKQIANTNGYKDLDCAKNGNIFEIDNNLLDRQSPRVVDGFFELAKIIHPELF